MGHINDMPPEGTYEEINDPRNIRGELIVEWVLVPEWPGPSGLPGLYWVTGLIGDDFDDYNTAVFEIDGSDYTLNMKRNNIRLLAYCLVKSSGDRMYPKLEQGIKEIGWKPQAGIERLATVARRLNGLDKGAKKRAEGNSSAPASSASSDSPSVSDTPVAELSSVT